MSGLTGRCNCGEVSYRVTGPFSPIVACHCTECRRASGHFVAATSAVETDLVIEGVPRWYESTPGTVRGFCPTCGAGLFWRQTPGRISIWAGSIDAPTNLALEAHIFTSEKGDYYEITDGLPSHPDRLPTTKEGEA
ncbi:GFA family protein [Tropicimonas sp. IMCC34011]|uniref:GFA family protein n=1 Tax=Tropicimonas sp. IMCC34011 TaxID=2248759 RepID=UPI000E267B0C|nr:GFA family protein [Tropicimonas sp. IMCC34011]